MAEFEARKNEGIKRLGSYMLQGWVLTDVPCPKPGCELPTLRSKEDRSKYICCLCDDTTNPWPATAPNPFANVTRSISRIGDRQLVITETTSSSASNGSNANNATRNIKPQGWEEDTSKIRELDDHEDSDHDSSSKRRSYIISNTTSTASSPNSNGTTITNGTAYESSYMPPLSAEDQIRIQRRREATDRASKLMGQRLLSGWTMLAETCERESCEDFFVPLMKKGDVVYCVLCQGTQLEESDGKKDGKNLTESRSVTFSLPLESSQSTQWVSAAAVPAPAEKPPQLISSSFQPILNLFGAKQQQQPQQQHVKPQEEKPAAQETRQINFRTQFQAAPQNKIAETTGRWQILNGPEDIKTARSIPTLSEAELAKQAYDEISYQNRKDEPPTLQRSWSTGPVNSAAGASIVEIKTTTTTTAVPSYDRQQASLTQQDGRSSLKRPATPLEKNKVDTVEERHVAVPTIMRMQRTPTKSPVKVNFKDVPSYDIGSRSLPDSSASGDRTAADREIDADIAALEEEERKHALEEEEARAFIVSKRRESLELSRQDETEDGEEEGRRTHPRISLSPVQSFTRGRVLGRRSVKRAHTEAGSVNGPASSGVVVGDVMGTMLETLMSRMTVLEAKLKVTKDPKEVLEICRAVEGCADAIKAVKALGIVV
ncbi:Protein ZNRD2 [Phlyctochytrium planicorne]|nr:Protein ZNRD2 [Phlyctochytrium planicorne]